MFSRLRIWPHAWIILSLVLAKATLSFAASVPSVVKTEQLGGADRYLAYVSTDKPIYRVGEKVYLRTVILNAVDNIPNKIVDSSIYVRIKGPKGDIVHEGSSAGIDGASGYQWEVPAGLAGGEYTALVSNPLLGVPESSRTFDIRSFRAPRLKTQIEFVRDGYGAGDTVKASVSIERAEGGFTSDAYVYAIARVDGREVYRSSSLPVSANGIVNTEFVLPNEINSGEGSLSFVIEDGGVVETATKSLPLLLEKMDVKFYPESGDLVAGLESRVYFQALLPNGKPADVRGRIVEMKNGKLGKETLTSFHSQHEGRGTFTFTPVKGTRYAAVFDAPSGISIPEPLPRVKKQGAVLKSAQFAFKFEDSIDLTLHANTVVAPAIVTLHKREVLLDSQAAGNKVITLDAKDAEGVLIATAWDKVGRPLAERLIFRHPRFGINIDLKLSNGPFIPGQDVSVDITTTDNNGNPVEAVVGITVTDDTVSQLIDKREQAPRLPTMVYLENDVLDLADAHVYLDKFSLEAEKSIDLLLGTQGWRRFVLVDYKNIKNQYPLDATHIMAENQRQHVQILRRLLQNDEAAEMPMLAAAPDIDANVIVEKAENAVRENKAQLQKQANDLAVLEEPRAEMEAPAMGKMMDDADRLNLFAPMLEQDRADFAGYIREFAFQARADRKPNQRTDFTETLYWNAGVKTGARDGRASVSFSLSDSVTTFQVMADGYGRNGALGSGNATIASVEPFYATIKLPTHAIVGDVIELPVTLVNTTKHSMSNAHLVITGPGISAGKTRAITLAAGQRVRHVVRVVVEKPGTFPITVVSEAGEYADTVTRSLTVAPAGFPFSINNGGLLSSENPFHTKIVIPNNIAKGSLVATAKLYPTPLASMDEALNALLREPHGCFEQTSSTNYPLVMAQQYFQTHTGIDPKLIAKSQGLLKTGYKKLIGYESADNGYEWFGANPAHEALTAYGLMEFSDMSKVMDIDQDMIGRTLDWLLSRRDGKGGFKRNDRALDSFGGAPQPTTNAYIVWALLESGQNPETIQQEIKRVKDQAFKGDDSYINALAANILYLAGDKTSADVLMKKLAKAVNAQGAVIGANTSITRSGGHSLDVETTSLAMLAWLRNEAAWAAQIESSIKWLFETVKAGRFGSTQSTVLALKVINAYDAARAKPKSPGSLQLYINGETFGEVLTFDSTTKGVIELPNFAHALSAGTHLVELRMTDGSEMPFSVDISFNTTLPLSSELNTVDIKTTLSHQSITEGEPLELQVVLSTGKDNVASPVAIVGIPAGLELQHDQLKELVGENIVSAYEVRDSELILYWRALKANANRSVPINLIASIPGQYTAPASRAYPYYTDEEKIWVGGHNIEVVAR